MKKVSKKNVAYIDLFAQSHPELTAIVRRAVDYLIFQNTPLLWLGQNKITPEHWRELGRERYFIAQTFELLLRAAIKQSKKVGDKKLFWALDWNLRDEIGMDTRGVIRKQLAHRTWREDFYYAISITPTMLRKESTLESVKQYNRIVSDLIKENDLLVMCGALLALEATIPLEFLYLKASRDATFPKIFLLHKTDSAKIRKQKIKNRRYIDDHIIHDADMHYPTLLRALEPYAKNKKSRARIARGARVISRARKNFYAELGKKIFTA